MVGSAVASEVEFKSSGLTLKGLLYRPSNVDEQRPGVVLCHGFGGVMEIVVAPFAERFAEHGYPSLVFDYRCNGASEGIPRGRIDPTARHDDIRAAIGFLAQQDGIDRDRLVLWGTSYGGAHSLFVGALDPRVHGVISQVPGTGFREVIAKGGRKLWDRLLHRVTDEFIERNETGIERTMAIAAPEGEPSMFPQPGVFEWFSKYAFDKPTFRNEFTVESILRSIEYTPTAFIDLIAPRPLLMVLGTQDDLASPKQAAAAFEMAGEPKRLVTFECGHFGLYECGPFHDAAVAVELEWLHEHFSLPG
jgi:fermentation-respiration switch protein FrsA (DUF1100 family)